MITMNLKCLLFSVYIERLNTAMYFENLPKKGNPFIKRQPYANKLNRI